MTKPNATVDTNDLAEVLDCLEALVAILRTFDSEQRGRHDADELLTKLSALDRFGLACWEPLRYQQDVGMGWHYVAENVEGLRARLVERYGDAAP